MGGLTGRAGPLSHCCCTDGKVERPVLSCALFATTQSEGRLADWCAGGGGTTI